MLLGDCSLHDPAEAERGTKSNIPHFPPIPAAVFGSPNGPLPCDTATAAAPVPVGAPELRDKQLLGIECRPFSATAAVALPLKSLSSTSGNAEDPPLPPFFFCLLIAFF